MDTLHINYIYTHIYICKIELLDIPCDSLYPEADHFTKFNCPLLSHSDSYTLVRKMTLPKPECDSLYFSIVISDLFSLIIPSLQTGSG